MTRIEFIGASESNREGAGADLISDTYRTLNRRLHQGGKFGRHGDDWAADVCRLAEAQGLSDVLDYGCGQGMLAKEVGRLRPGLPVREYDPAIAGKDALPSPADLVVCTDVLEHIEPELLDNVLDHLQTLSRSFLFAVIATRPAKKVLEDGRNAHLIVQPEGWWRPRLAQRFHIVEWRGLEKDFAVVLRALPAA